MSKSHAPLTSEILDRLPPQDLQAEREILGAALLAPETLDLAMRSLRGEDFYSDAHQRIYAALVELRDHNVGIEVTLLVDRLRAHGELEQVGGPAYLAEILHATPTTANVVHHAQIVVRHSQRRKIIYAAQDALRAAWDMAREPAEVVAQVEAQLQLLGGQARAQEPRPVAEVIPEAMLEIEEVAKRHGAAGVMTGVHVLDESTGGLFAGELSILAARPSIGKTSLGIQIGHHVAQRQPVYVASLEMGDRELVTRLLCSLGGVSSKRIRTGRLDDRELQALVASSSELGQTHLWIHDNPGLTVQQISRACRRLAKDGLALAVIDYLGLVNVTDQRKKRYEQVGDICKSLKALARELKIPVLLLCQLNRQTESAGKGQKTPRPRLHHLRESGDIEQTADMVLLLHRDDPTTPGEKVTITLLDVAKNRNGETGGMWLEWDAPRTRYLCATPANHESAFDEYNGGGTF